MALSFNFKSNYCYFKITICFLFFSLNSINSNFVYLEKEQYSNNTVINVNSSIDIEISQTLFPGRQLYSTSTHIKNVVYSPPYKDNNVTGTGNLLRDVIYNIKCQMLSCDYCCTGLPNSIICDTESVCQVYYNYAAFQRLIPMIIVLSVYFGIYFILIIIFACVCGDFVEGLCMATKAMVYLTFFIFIEIFCCRDCLFDDRKKSSTTSSTTEEIAVVQPDIQKSEFNYNNDFGTVNNNNTNNYQAKYAADYQNNDQDFCDVPIQINNEQPYINNNFANNMGGIKLMDNNHKDNLNINNHNNNLNPAENNNNNLNNLGIIENFDSPGGVLPNEFEVLNYRIVNNNNFDNNFNDCNFEKQESDIPASQKYN